MVTSSSVGFVRYLDEHSRMVVVDQSSIIEVLQTLDCTSLDITAVQIFCFAKFYFCDSVSNNKQYVIYGKRAHIKGGALGI